MTSSDGQDYSDMSLLHLFSLEAETQTALLNDGLLTLERDPQHAESLEVLMRAAHSLKGAARIVQLGAAERVAHVMEDCFVAAQEGRLVFTGEHIEVLLQGVDVLTRLAQAATTDAAAEVLAAYQPEVDAQVAALRAIVTPGAAPLRPPPPRQAAPGAAHGNDPRHTGGDNGPPQVPPAPPTASAVATRPVEPVPALDEPIPAQSSLVLAQSSPAPVQSRSEITPVLSREVVDKDRMVRDIARRLEKKVSLEIIGRATEVDRDILERLEAPLSHLLRNAIDHGIELPEERRAVGKPEEGTIRLEAAHKGGMLSITVSDDGRGVELERLRQKIINTQLTTADIATALTEVELMEFLFLPGFSTKASVTEISGRGVGLDVVHEMAREVGGTVRAVSEPGQGMHFYLQLPLTLSVLRTLVVEIAGEPYAFPLARIDRALMLPRDDIDLVAGRQYFTIDAQHIGLVSAHQVLELQESRRNGDTLPVIVISDRLNCYGLVVDRFMDLIMPVLDGVEATRQIMAASPCLILVVTATVSGNMAKVFAAMGYGARDVVHTPVLGSDGKVEGGAALLDKIAMLGELLTPTLRQESQRLTRSTAHTPTRYLPPLVAIGASTGGPAALACVLSGLPAHFPAALVIIQHVDVQFAAGLADWLQAQTALPVRLAQEGCRLEVGTVWLAGTNDHMVLTQQHTLSYVAEPRDYPYRPSVDVFFKSLLKNGPAHWPAKAAGVLLTGMGRDGAEGLAVLRRAGWYTLAQDQASSVIYGMPKAAAEVGAAMQILSLEAMASTLVQFFGESRL